MWVLVVFFLRLTGSSLVLIHRLNGFKVRFCSDLCSTGRKISPG